MIREKDVVYGLTLVWSLAAVFGGQVRCVAMASMTHAPAGDKHTSAPPPNRSGKLYPKPD